MSTSESLELAQTIFQQIACGFGVDGSVGLTCLRSWGMHDLCMCGPTDQFQVALGFYVNGHLHQGFVQVELTYMDTYTVRLMTAPEQPPRVSVDDVYFNELCETIDRLVEHDGNRETYERRCQASPFGSVVNADGAQVS